MPEQFPIGLLITGAILILGFLAPAIIVLVMRAYKQATCTEQTTAIIIDYKAVASQQDITFHPVYKYVVDGQTVTKASAYSSTSFVKKYQPGDTVCLYYNPNKPQGIYVPAENKGINLLIGGFAGFACLIALIFGLIAMRYLR